ncbi:MULTISPECIES: hypothetical protein [Pseudomonas]|uniref:hypothetical protein n=1 Tax=Pseudomonas TaxID=286 RepID=UPI0030DC7E20
MNIGINVDANVSRRWSFIPHDRARTKVRFYKRLMGRHQINQALVALAFSARISHAIIIVRNDDGVNIQ